MVNRNRLEASTRVAFAALIHDIGKFAQRANLPLEKDKLTANLQLYCPYHQVGNYFSHHHAAYTGIALEQIEPFFPDLIKSDCYPFSSRTSQTDITDSILNAAAAHHKPATFLQWVIATADRVASGFEREEFEQYNKVKQEEINQLSKKNHYQTRLLTLFSKIQLNQPANYSELEHCYPLKPLTANSLFPLKRAQYEPQNDKAAQQEYHELWKGFLQGLDKIPPSHRHNWQLWLDHFDSLWQVYTQAIPSATYKVRPEVSLYDHSKTTAALATALWRWHEEHQKTDERVALSLKNRAESWNEEKFLLIQGDFFGIQDFIFSAGKETNKQVAKLLRGRSFQVSLFSELAALKVLQACELPSTSQIINAAGKFMIVAPNTAQVRQAIEQVQQALNQWFIKHTYGLVGLGLAILPASCNDFIGNQFKVLVKELFKQLEFRKGLRRLE